MVMVISVVIEMRKNLEIDQVRNWKLGIFESIKKVEVEVRIKARSLENSLF